MFTQIKDNLPLITALILIISGTRLVIYYWTFGIDITSYIDLSEVITLMFDYLIFGSLVGLFVLFIYIIHSTKIFLDSIDIENNSSARIKRRISNYVLTAKFIRNIYIFIGILLIIYKAIFNPQSIVILLFGVYATILGARHYLEFSVPRNPSKTFLETRKKTWIIAYGCAFVYLNIFLATADAYILRTFKSEKKVTIEYQGKLIRTSSSYVYVGRTKNFIFFYNRRTKFAHAYPNSDIKRVYMRDFMLFYANGGSVLPDKMDEALIYCRVWVKRIFHI